MKTYSELIKIKNPITKSYSRTSYYINVKFMIHGDNIGVPMKVDTGASHTIVGTGSDVVKNYKEYIITKGKAIGEVHDAQDNPIYPYAYNVKQFKLSEDITFPELQICFSEELGEKAVLGMDILSLFNFSYRLDPHSTNGTFIIHDYQAAMDRLLKSKYYQNNGFIMPSMILTMDDESQHSNQKSEGLIF